MDEARKARGQQIATANVIRKTVKGYIVPSQSGQGKYAVTVDGDKPSCTCPDHETHGGPCKHIYAVQIVIQQEFVFDGETVRKTVTVTQTVERKTYPQNWPKYNAAQTSEGDQFQVLLHDLCAGLPEPEQKRGRPRATLADSVFCATLKVYSTMSTRRFMSDLREAKERGHIAKVPHQSSVFRYLEDAALTPVLRALVERSALPLQAVEVDFAADSTGFTSSRFEAWFDHKYGVTRRKHTWVKAHMMVGVKTNVVTAIEIHGRDANDGTQLPALVETTARHFPIGDVTADKAYGTVRNADAIAALGGTPFIPFKSSHSGRGSHKPGWSAGTGAWAKMYAYFVYRQDEFMAHYHQRSNVEATFSMMKRKFGDALRTKTDTAMVNEVLCKVLCHNLTVLVHAMHELGITPAFQPEAAR